MLLDARPHRFGCRLEILENLRRNFFLRKLALLGNRTFWATSQPPAGCSTGERGQDWSTELH